MVHYDPRQRFIFRRHLLVNHLAEMKLPCGKNHYDQYVQS